MRTRFIGASAPVPTPGSETHLTQIMAAERQGRPKVLHMTIKAPKKRHHFNPRPTRKHQPLRWR